MGIMIPSIIVGLFLVMAAYPAYAGVQTLELEKSSYTNNDIMKFSGVETNGSKAVSVVIRSSSGNFVGLLGDPLSDPDGNFETVGKKVSEIFSSSGIYNATGFSDTQKESEGLTLRLEYDGRKVILLPSYTLALVAIGDKSVEEGERVSFTARVTDSSLDELTYSLDGEIPDGASINSSTGQFTWTPSSTHGHPRGVAYTFDVVVTKDSLKHTESVTVTVTEPEATEPEPKPAPQPEPEPEPEPEPAPSADTEKMIPAPFVDKTADPQSYVDRYFSEASYKKWFDQTYPEYASIYEAVGLEEPLLIPAPFVDKTADPQSYVDRYFSEASYKKWFDDTYPEYASIYEAVGLEKPLLIPAPFVDKTADPQSYVDRYFSEASYKKWFDDTYPEYSSIYEAVGLEESKIEESESGQCGIGTQLVDGKCEIIPNQAGGGCLIATAAFGSELAPQVQLLREVRDNTLLSTESGTSFMSGFNDLYYSFSPSIADLERQSPVFRETVKLFITPMLSTLSIMTLAEEGSESSVLGLGLSVIALNLGMYIAAPAVICLKVRGRLKAK